MTMPVSSPSNGKDLRKHSRSLINGGSDSSTIKNSKEMINDIAITYCDHYDSAEEQICLISNSMEMEDNGNVSVRCKDCIECPRVKNHPEAVEAMKESVFTQSCGTDEPILVDLTTDETKTTWKHTMLKRFCSSNDFESSRGAKTMIADSSSRLHRGSTGSSLATALRDRGPCVIPVQPNRSLPIRPAPPAPTRSSRKDRTPVLKLSKLANVDVVEVETTKPVASGGKHSKQKDAALKEVEDEEGGCKNSVGSGVYVFPKFADVGRLSVVKRKSNDEKEGGRETKKRKKSLEADSSQPREERGVNVAKECSKSAATKKDSSSQQVVEIRSEKKYPASALAAGSVAGESAERDKETGNKLVPPLRLKKVVRTEILGHRSSEISTEPEKELNYRIVTGGTPRPESRSSLAITPSSWSSVDPEDSFEITPENSVPLDSEPRRVYAKSDECKLKYRRNRLRQKLRELRGKAVELAGQMSNPPAADESSPEENTRLRQAMNRYEKQIENLSKLICKLSAAIPISDDVVNVDDEKGLYPDEFTDIEVNDDENGDLVKCVSPNASPEPPKLSPRSPINYNESKSPRNIRNSPPVLPRVCLTIPTNLDSTNDEERKLSVSEATWKITECTSSISSDTNGDHKDFCKQMPAEYENVEDCTQRADPTASSLTMGTREDNLMEMNSDEIDFKDSKESMNCSSKLINSAKSSGDDEVIKEKKEPQLQEKAMESLSLINEDREDIESFKISESESKSEKMSNSPPEETRETVVPVTVAEQKSMPSAVTNILQLQSNYYGPTITKDNILFAGVTNDARNVQKVTSRSNPAVILNCAPTPFASMEAESTAMNSPRIAIAANNKADAPLNNIPARPENTNRIMTEQFPTLGNWVARMSKKHFSKSKSKLPAPPIEDPNRISGLESQKGSVNPGNNSCRNNMVNVSLQWNTERWQKQQQQQRQHQQLLHQVAASGTTQQPLPTTPSLRSNICPQVSMTQFYPNGYTIDPYSGAPVGCHSAMCPYGPYPYHPRLHSGPPVPGYHLPIQDNLSSQLRPLQHVNKRMSPLQDQIRHFPTDIIRFHGPLPTAGYQHPNGLDFDRLHSSASNNVATTACLPPLLLPPPPQLGPALASTTQQAVPRNSLAGFSSNNNQFGRNRMIPDVVAAAAAAAVVAAASFGSQQPSLTTYNRSGSEETSTTGVTNAIDTQPVHTLNANKSRPTHEINTQLQLNTNNINEEARLSTSGYQQLQNLFLDQLPFVRNVENFAQNSSAVTEAQTTTYKVPTVSTSHTQLTKEVPGNDVRYCETPHLGKVNRSPNTLNNIPCSNCGLGGSMFKCLGCEMAFYCDERCQTRHWNVHVEKCPKKMPKLKKVV